MDIILKRQSTIIFTAIIGSIIFFLGAANYPLICLAVALSFLMLLTSLYFKEKVFFAFVFLYPLIPSYFAFELGDSFPLMTMGRLLLIYVVLFDLVFNRDKFRKMERILGRSEIKLIVLAVGWLLFTYIFNYFKYPDVESFKMIISFFLEELCLGTYIFLRAGSLGEVEKVIKCFLFAALFIACTGMIEFTLKVNLFSFLDIVQSSRQLFSSDVYARLGENRIEGPFGHPLAYCNFLLMAIPLGIYQWQTGKNLKVKTAYFLGILILLMNLLFTLSRGPMLALIIGMLIYFALTNKRSKQILFMLVMIITGLLFIAITARVIPWFIRNFFISILDSVFMKDTSGFGADSNASEYRLYLFDLAKRLVKGSYIWFGRGMSFFRVNEVYDWIPGRSFTRESRVTSIDNFYILKYIQMGVVGIFSYLIFILSLIYASFLNFARNIHKEFYLCFLFAFVSYFISLFTVDEIGTFKYLWILTGILMAKISLSRCKNEKDYF